MFKRFARLLATCEEVETVNYNVLHSTNEGLDGCYSFFNCGLIRYTGLDSDRLIEDGLEILRQVSPESRQLCRSVMLINAIDQSKILPRLSPCCEFGHSWGAG